MKGVLKSVLKPVLKGVLAVYNAAVSYLIDLRPSDSTNARIIGQGTNDTDGTIYSANSVDLDGGTGFITVTTNFDTWDSTQSFEINLWFSPNQLGRTERLFNTDDERISILKTVANTIAIQLRESGTNGADQRTITTVNQDKWQYLSVRYDGSESASGITFFLDGAEMAKDSPVQNNFNSTFSSTAGAAFGVFRQNTTPIQYFDGQIGETTIDINGVRAHTWGFESGKEAIFFDSTTDIAATLNGGATWITGLSGFNYDVAVSQALRDFPANYPYLDNKALSVPNDGVFNDFGTDTFSIEVDTYLADKEQVFCFTEFAGSGIGWRFRDSRVLLSDGSSFVECNFGTTTRGAYNTLGFIVDRTNNLLKTTVNGVETGITADISSIGAITDNSKSLSIGRAGTVPSEAVVREVRVYNSSDTLIGTYNSSDYATIGTLTAGTHIQQFPEIGLPQPANRNSNLYDVFDGSSNYVIADAGEFDPAADGQTVYVDFIFKDQGSSTSGQIWAYRDQSTELIQIVVFEDTLVLQARGSDNIIKVDNITGISDNIRITGTLTFNGILKTASLVTNIGTNTISGWGSISSSSLMTIGANNTGSGYGVFYEGQINRVNVNSTNYINPAGWNGLTVQGTEPVEKPIPAKSTNPEEDTFDTAIANSIFDAEGNQIAWNYQDGQGSGDTNATAPIDANVGFEVSISNFLFTDTGAIQVLLSNRNTSDNGLLIYITSDKKLGFIFRYDASNYVSFVTPALTEDTKYDNATLTYDGDSGLAISVNGASQSLTDNSLGSITGQTIPNDHTLQIGQDPDGDNKIQGIIGRTTLRLT